METLAPEIEQINKDIEQIETTGNALKVNNDGEYVTAGEFR